MIMGYQETFITTKTKKHFSDFLFMVKEFGKEYYDSNSVKPSYIVTVKKDVYGMKYSFDDMSGIVNTLRNTESAIYAGLSNEFLEVVVLYGKP